MSLQKIYQSFLATPSAVALTSHASLNYITTLTTINDATAIAKHLTSQTSTLKKKEEKVLSSIEGDNAICLDVETTLEFVTGGGAYLPGLDDNFLADRVVTFPVVHIVHFESNQKIQQIRLYWDQGSLLKLVDVIGSRAKNWPIRDGKDQARLIASSAANATQGKEHTRSVGDVTITSKVSSPKKNRSKDPHTPLSLFSPREPNHEYSNVAPAVPPRTSAKPPPRDYRDLFAGESDDPSEADLKASSPPKKALGAVAPKGGAGKNFQPSRLFDTDESHLESNMSQQSPDKHIQVHPTKYSHFDFSDEAEQPIKQESKLSGRPKTKHQSQWDFEDFSTPEKVSQKVRAQDVRHFDTGDDDSKIEGPPKENNTIQPRRDAQTHFDFEDAGTAAAERRPAEKQRGKGSNNGMGLYQNNLYDDAELAPSPEKKNHQPNGAMANMKDRRKDFDPHSELTNSSPSLGEKTASDKNRPIPGNRTKAVKMMDAQWEATDESPNARSGPTRGETPHPHSDTSTFSSKDKENYSIGGDKYMTNTGIKTSGDGMGGKRGTDYDYGNGAEGRGLKGTAIKTGGDGMGGKKGAGRSWGFGDESDEDGVDGVNGGKFQAGKKQQRPKDSVLWDF